MNGEPMKTRTSLAKTASLAQVLAALLVLGVLVVGCGEANVRLDVGTEDANVDPLLSCADRPCGRFGECTTDPVLGGVWDCLPWRLGRTCDVFDFCFAATCNHGSCVNGETGFTCECDAGFTGADCSQDINECASASACSGRGTCTNSVGSFACACDPGFTGATCATNVDDCASLTCGSGTCIDEVQRAYCSCPAATGGPRCDVPATDCSPSPCVRGTCVEAAGVFDRCDCPVGSTGTYCESSVDDCLGTPCANGSRCQDGDNTYTCAGCVGFSGQDCDVPVTCAGSPPAAPLNGAAGAPTGSSFGDSVTYTCDGNFRLTGSATSTCRTDGTWSLAPTCECESHVLTYDLTGDYYIFAPVVDPFRAVAGQNIPEINTLPFGPGYITLRVSANGDATGDGPVSVLDMFLPLEFEQRVQLSAEAFLDEGDGFVVLFIAEDREGDVALEQPGQHRGDPLVRVSGVLVGLLVTLAEAAHEVGDAAGIVVEPVAGGALDEHGGAVAREAAVRFPRMTRQARLFEHRVARLGDGRERVHQRSVEVEDDQFGGVGRVDRFGVGVHRVDRKQSGGAA